jgi:hypothetical protein
MELSVGEILDANNLKLWKLEDGSLVMKHSGADGCRKALIGPPRRALPLSDPDRWIIFSDLEGVEVGVLPAVEDLPEPSQTILRDALKDEYRLERIVRVLEVDREPLSGQTRWRVQIAAEEDAPAASDNEPSASTSGVSGASGASTPGASTSPAPGGNGSNGETGEAAEEAPESGLSKMASLLSLGSSKDAAEDLGLTVEREFAIAGQEDVQTARYPHIFLVDTERRRYEIPDCEALDLESRKAAERFF